MPPIEPPSSLIDAIFSIVTPLLEEFPLASSNEAYLQNRIEHALMVQHGYGLRLGINYHGDCVQVLRLNADGKLIGWNPSGDVFGRAEDQKLVLKHSLDPNSGTIFDREAGEPAQVDTKVQGGPSLSADEYVRIEHKVRGWDGKSRNLDGEQFLKDIVLLQHSHSDLLHWTLSEAAYRKWRGEGPSHQVDRRSGLTQFRPILAIDPDGLNDHAEFDTRITGSYTPRTTVKGIDAPLAVAGITHTFNVPVRVSLRRVHGAALSVMPSAMHIVALIRRRMP